MFTDITSIVLFSMTGLLLTSFSLLRVRTLRTAHAKNALRPAKLLRGSTH